MKKKGLAILISFMLLGAGIGAGTLAWLTAKTETVTNTFTTSDISVELTETAGGDDHTFQMIPGYTIAKDPKASVKAGSEECWLFVKLVKSSNFDEFLQYEIAEGWTQLKEDKDGNDITDLIYYRKVESDDIGTEYSVLKDDEVTVLDNVTKEMMADLLSTTYPTLSVTAYASQLHKNAETEFTAAEAWANVGK